MALAALPMATIYMTEEQDLELRSTVQERRRKCEEVRDEPRQPRDSKDLLAQATSASLMSDMAAATGSSYCDSDRMPALEVGTPYLPSTVKIFDLEPMKLCDLRLDNHHRGYMLKLSRKGPVVSKPTCSWTIVQEITDPDDTERLQVVLHNKKHDEDTLEQLSDFIIKEPYLTLSDSGEPTLRVDHPSDIVDLDILPFNGKRNTIGTANVFPKHCKEDGNAALRRNDLAEAHSCYSKGLQVILKRDDKEVTVTNDLFRNRSHTNLLLGRFDEAASDAMASLTFKTDSKSLELDSKAFFRGGCAAYALEKWADAKRLFEQQLELTPDDRAALFHLRKISLRLGEQSRGEFHFSKLRSGLSRARPRVDAATSLGKTEIRSLSGRGRGLCAAEDIGAGKLIMCEKAFCIAWSHEDLAFTAMTYDVRDDRVRAFPAGLAQAVVQKLRNNPSQVQKVQALYGDHAGLGEELVMIDDGPVIDTFQIHDIICRNAFSPGPQFGEEDARAGSAGLWIQASYMNHSCLPNTEREFIGDLMIVRATKDIKSGEEITHIYSEARDVDERAEALMRTWGFECDCARCEAEKADGVALRKERGDLEDKVNALIASEDPKKAGPLMVRKIECMAKTIEATYDEERYESLPRLALSKVEKWLDASRPRVKKRDSKIAS